MSRDPAIVERLEAEFLDVWPGARTTGEGEWRLGGHAHGSRSAWRRFDRHVVAVDGDGGLYRRLAEASEPGPGGPLSRLRGGGGASPPLPDGNAAALDAASGSVVLEESVSGAYPLYWVSLEEGFLFSSHLRPLARAVGAEPDPLGIVCFLERGWIVGERTFFGGIRRLRPGDTLRWTPDDGPDVRPRSEVWAEDASARVPGAKDPVEAVWTRLRAALAEGVPKDDRWALMMSGGWDSRTLLGARPGDRSDPVGFSHGDVGSRELDLARRVCEAAGVPARQEGIDASFLDPALLEELFGRVELAMFPYWCRSGGLLAERGADRVTAGVYGEVVGGHYGPAMLRSGWRKIATVARGLAGLGVEAHRASAADLPAVRDVLLRGVGRKRPTGLASAVWASVPGPRAALAADVDAHLGRLLERGVPTRERLVEAFVTEHRGAQYIHGQLRSARARLDVATPFAESGLLSLAGSLPLAEKIHNRLNRRMLRRHAPELLDLPLAATLVPASRPVWWQEASRLGRKLREDGHWRLHRATSGVVPPPRLAWINFEGLREGGALRRLASSLTSDLWDQAEIRELVRRGEEGEWSGSMHPVVHQLLTMYTVESMLR